MPFQVCEYGGDTDAVADVRRKKREDNGEKVVH